MESSPYPTRGRLLRLRILLLGKLGFRIFNVARFPDGPEADVTWINEKLLVELAPKSWRLRQGRATAPPPG